MTQKQLKIEAVNNYTAHFLKQNPFYHSSNKNTKLGEDLFNKQDG